VFAICVLGCLTTGLARRAQSACTIASQRLSSVNHSKPLSRKVIQLRTTDIWPNPDYCTEAVDLHQVFPAQSPKDA